MAGQEPGAGPWAADARSVTAALLSLEREAVSAEASRVSEAGSRMAEQAGELVAALGAAAVAAGGVHAGVSGGLLGGPALAECAALLARRVRGVAADTDDIAGNMTRAADLLVAADEEVARDVAGAAG